MIGAGARAPTATMASRTRLWSSLLGLVCGLTATASAHAQPAPNPAEAPPARPDWFGERTPLRRTTKPKPPAATPKAPSASPPRWFGEDEPDTPATSRQDPPEWFTDETPLAPPLSPPMAEGATARSQRHSVEHMRVADAVKVPRNAGYDDGFFLRADDGSVAFKLKGQLQVWFDYQGLDGVEDQVAFAVHRARLRSWVKVKQDLEFHLHFSADRGVVAVQDATVDYRLPRGDVHVQAGQFKKPFSRQFIASSQDLALVERSITHTAFDAGRDLGVAVHNDYAASPTVEYAFGVFNGSGDLPTLSGEVQVDPASGLGRLGNTSESNVPHRFRPTALARLGFNHGGGNGYTESDFQGGSVRFGAAAAGQLHFDVDDDDDSGAVAGLDYYVKAHGFSTRGALYLRWDQDPLSSSFSDQLHQASGMHVQASYLIGKRLEPALRYARINNRGADNDVRELTAGINIYALGNDLKLQTEGGALFTQAPGDRTRSDARLRVQLQGAF
jgi:hypothetical protein